MPTARPPPVPSSSRKPGLRVRASQAGSGNLINVGTSPIAGAPPGTPLGPLSTAQAPVPGTATAATTPTGTPVPTGTPAPAAGGRPANDAFASASALTVPSSVSGTTVGATIESGEPTGCGAAASVWYRLQPAASGLLSILLNSGSYNPGLALYSGTSLSALTLIACNDDYGGTYQAELSATLAAGQVYYLQLGGYNGAYGAFALRLSTT